MEIFRGSKGISLTVKEFKQITEMDLLDQLIETLRKLDGELNLIVEGDYEEGVIEDMIDGLIEHEMEYIDEEVNDEDLRVISLLRRLGYQ